MSTSKLISKKINEFNIDVVVVILSIIIMPEITNLMAIFRYAFVPYNIYIYVYTFLYIFNTYSDSKEQCVVVCV